MNNDRSDALELATRLDRYLAVNNRERFQNRRQVGSDAGLTGGVSASGQSTADPSIPKSSNRRSRTELVECR